MAINKFFVKNSPWKDVLAIWDGMDSDLKNYYAYYGYFIETDESTTEYLRVAKQLSSSDSWRLQIHTGYYQNGVEIVGTAKGYFPLLNKWHEYILEPGDYNLIRYDTKLSAGSLQINAATFKEGTVPYCLGILVHGAGGGGGGTWGSDDGTGGGAGGCVTGVIKLDRNYTLHVGAGGAGGYKHEVHTSVEGGGKSGETAYIYTIIDGHSDQIFSAGGGGYGRASTKKQSYAGGTGGSWYSIDDSGAYAGYANCVTGADGGNGGRVYGLGNATGMGKQTVRFTNLTTVISGATHAVMSVTSGGAQGDNNAPGGGGGGREYDGPAGGGYTSDGKAGERGCGGSGARYTFLNYKRGGKGGDGYIMLFY